MANFRFFTFKAQPDGHHVPIHSQYPQENNPDLLRTDSHYDYETSQNQKILHANYVETNLSPGLDAESVVPSENGEGQVGSPTR